MKLSRALGIKEKNSHTEILIYSVIGRNFGYPDGITSREFAAIFSKAESIGKPVHIRINCPGGFIHEGIAIFNIIRASKVDVYCYVDGIAASMGSVIALAGKRLYISKYGRLMTHRASGEVQGDADHMRNYANELESLETTMAEIYAEKTGLTIEDARNKYLKTGVDRWITAKQAFDEKISDGIYELNHPALPEKENKMVALWGFFNKNLSQKNQKFMLLEDLISMLNLPEDSTDSDVLKAVKTLMENSPAKETAQKALALMAGRCGIDKEKQSLYAMAIESNPAKAFEMIFSQLVKTSEQGGIMPNLLNLSDIIKNEPKSMFGQPIVTKHEGKNIPAKAQWGLDEYRKYAPNELQNNDALYEELLKRGGLL